MDRRRNNYQRSYGKTQWELDKENAERERQEKLARNMEDTLENFPTLGGAKSVTPNSWGRSFKTLASEWKADEDDRKADEEAAAKQKDNRQGKYDGIVVPKFAPVRRFVEEDEEEEFPTQTPVAAATTEDDDESGWTTIDRKSKYRARKARKNARIEEKLRRLDDGEELEEEQNDEEKEEDESCWNVPESHETCWDDKGAKY